MDEEIFEKRFLLCFQKVAFSSNTCGREVKAEKKNCVFKWTEPQKL